MISLFLAILSVVCYHTTPVRHKMARSLSENGNQMRSAPKIEPDNSIGAVWRNETVSVLSEADGWYKIMARCKVGYVKIRTNTLQFEILDIPFYYSCNNPIKADQEES